MKSVYEINDLRAFLVITGVLIFFYLYYYLAHSSFFEKSVSRYSSESIRELHLFFSRKLSGVIFLGALPFLMYYLFLDGSFSRFGISLYHFFDNFHLIAVLAFVIVIILFYRHKKNPGHNTLQIKTRRWTGNLFMLNFSGWFFYLLAYEFLFRGILLFECYEIYGFWTAVAINITIYSAIHMVNGRDQAIGALLFGAVACYFTLTRGTILIPLFMHITLSTFSDYFSIKMNPAIGFEKSNSVQYTKL